MNTWIYRSGDQIKVQLESHGGSAPITWNYKNLPKGLRGNNNGMISGYIQQEGLYSFSADCGDARGQKASSFYTLNVQPGTLIRTNNIIDVPDRNVGLVYDIKQVEAQQIAADNAVAKALIIVENVKNQVRAQQSAQARTQLAFNLAAGQEAKAAVNQQKAQQLFDRSVEINHRA